MTKLIRPLIITAVVLAVFVGGYFLLDKLGPPSEASSSPNIIHLIETSAEVDRVKVEPADSPAYEVTVTKSDNGTAEDTSDDTTVYNVLPAAKGFGYDQTTLSYIVDYFNTLVSYYVIKENPTQQDLAEYGLDSPLCKVKGTYKDGSTKELLVGDKTVSQDGYYAKLADSDTVYTIYTSAGDTFTKKEVDLRTLSLFPASDDLNDAAINVKSVTFTKPDKSYISLRRRTEEEQKKIGSDASTFELTIMNRVYEANDSDATNEFIAPILNISYLSVVEDNPSDLSKYGLDSPYRVKLIGTDDVEYAVSIGNESKDGGRYFMKDGVNSVLLSSSDFSFMKAGKLDLMSTIIWIYNIDKVVKAEYDLNGEKHALNIDSDSDNGTFKASLDGADITETNARRLYSRTLSIFVEGELTADKAYGSPQYSIKLTLKDGSAHTMDLCPINSRQYAVVLDGKAEFYTSVKDIESLLNGFTLNAKGEEIPSL